VPKISTVEQEQIKSIAKRFSMGLWASPFNEGLLIYSETFNALYIRSARWKYCLKCGEIEPTEQMLDQAELKKIPNGEKDAASIRVHKCTLGVSHFPVLITTSWFKLKNFFLTDLYIQALQDAGVTDRFDQIPIIKQLFAEAREMKTPEKAGQEEPS
jgi:hypothetical protein